MKNFELSRKITSNRQKLTALNVEKLKGILSYFSSLHVNGEISDKAFEALVRHACSIFIENEVEIVVQQTLERKFVAFLRSKFITSAEDIQEIESAIYSLNISDKVRSR